MLMLSAINFNSLVSLIIVVAVIVIVLAIIASNIRVVQQSKAMVVERLGAFRAVWGVGIHVKIPFIDRIAKSVSLKEQVADFPLSP